MQLSVPIPVVPARSETPRPGEVLTQARRQTRKPVPVRQCPLYGMRRADCGCLVEQVLRSTPFDGWRNPSDLLQRQMERKTGFEPATLTLARWWNSSV